MQTRFYRYIKHSLLFGATGLTGLTAWGGYSFYKSLKKKAEIERFCHTSDDYFSELEALQPQDKLYLLNEPTQHFVNTLDLHKHVARTLDEKRQTLSSLIGGYHRIQKGGLMGASLGLVWRDFGKVMKHIIPDLNTHALLAPFDVVTALNHAQRYRKLRHYGRAMSYGEQALSTLDEQPELTLAGQAANQLKAHTYNILAKIACGQAQHNASEAYYDLALEKVPKDPYILSSRAALYGDRVWKNRYPPSEIPTKLTTAIRDLRQVIKGYPQYEMAKVNLAGLLIIQDKNMATLNKTQVADLHHFSPYPLEAVLEVVDERTVTNVDTPNGYLFRGIALKRLNRTSEALSVFEAGLARYPYHPSLLNKQAGILEQQGELGAAIEAYEWLDIALNHRIHHYFSGEFYVKRLKKARDKGADLSKKVATKAPLTPAQKTYRKGELLLQRNNVPGAYGAFTSLLNDNNKDSVIAKRAQNRVDWIEECYQVNNNFRAVIYEQLMRMLDIVDEPIPYTFASMSVNAYQVKYHKGTHAFPTVGNWQAIALSNEERFEGKYQKAGYHAVAYQHAYTKQIIIAHAGTEFDDTVEFLRDLAQDGRIALGRKTDQLHLGHAFTEEVVSAHKHGTRPVYHTGHSLGGMVASQLACEHEPDSELLDQHKAVVFDDPGCWLQTLIFDIPKARYPVISYVRRPNFINTNDEHVGRMFYIGIDWKPQQLGDSVWKSLLTSLRAYLDSNHISVSSFKESLLAHSKEAFLKGLSENPQLLYKKTPYYVTRWPKGIAQWGYFEALVEQNQHDGYRLDTSVKDNKLRTLLEERAYVQLSPFKVEAGELIPIEALEEEVKKLLMTYKRAPEHLTPAQQAMVSNMDRAILSKGYTISEDNKFIVCAGPLNAWAFEMYITKQIRETCQKEHVKLFSPREEKELEAGPAYYGSVFSLGEKPKVVNDKTNTPSTDKENVDERNYPMGVSEGK